MRRALALAVLAVSVTGCVTLDTFEKKEAEAKRYHGEWKAETQKREALEKKLAEVETQLEAYLAEIASLQEKLRHDEGSLAVKEHELRTARERLAATQALVDELSKSKRKLEAAKAELEKKSDEYAQLASSLRTEIEAGRIELMELRGRTTVQLKDKILFASGSATVGAEGRDALRKVADALRNMQSKVIRVEGHTDNVPTGGGTFPSNWELSTARAVAVVHVLKDAGVDPTRLFAAGFAEFQPIATNDTPEGRSLNRRIEIVLMPVEGAVPIPKAAAPPATVPAKF